MILAIVSFYLKKTYNYEKLTLHYCRYPGNWLGIRIFCLPIRKYYPCAIGYSNYSVAFGRYKKGMMSKNDSKSQNETIYLILHIVFWLAAIAVLLTYLIRLAW
jgi:hypothetical protein